MAQCQTLTKIPTHRCIVGIASAMSYRCITGSRKMKRWNEDSRENFWHKQRWNHPHGSHVSPACVSVQRVCLLVWADAGVMAEGFFWGGNVLSCCKVSHEIRMQRLENKPCPASETLTHTHTHCGQVPVSLHHYSAANKMLSLFHTLSFSLHDS